MLHSGQLNDRTIEIDGDEDVIFEEDDEEDEGYFFAGQGIGKIYVIWLENRVLTSTRMEYWRLLIYVQMVNPTMMAMLLHVEMMPMCRM